MYSYLIANKAQKDKTSPNIKVHKVCNISEAPPLFIYLHNYQGKYAHGDITRDTGSQFL